MDKMGKHDLCVSQKYRNPNLNCPEQRRPDWLRQGWIQEAMHSLEGPRHSLACLGAGHWLLSLFDQSCQTRMSCSFLREDDRDPRARARGHRRVLA